MVTDQLVTDQAAIGLAWPIVLVPDPRQEVLAIFWASIVQFDLMAVLHLDLDARVAVTAPALETDQKDRVAATVLEMVIDQGDQVAAIGLASEIVQTDQYPSLAIDRIGLAEAIDRIDLVEAIDRTDPAEAIDRIGQIGSVATDRTVQDVLIGRADPIALAARVNQIAPGGTTVASITDLAGRTVQEVATSTIAGRDRDAQDTAWAIGLTVTPIAIAVGITGVTTSD